MSNLQATGLDAASVYTDMQGLRALKEAAHEQSPDALRGVAQQFEALFIGMMLDSMRTATAAVDGGLFDSQESELYQQLFDRQIAQKIAGGRGLGIAAALERQLSRMAGQQQQDPAAAPSTGGARAEAGGIATPATAAGSTGTATAFSAETPADFVATVLPHAQKVAADLGIHPLAIVAQAALETGWGQRLPKRADGGSSFNFFGIKAGSDWAGAQVVRSTMEHVGGALRQQTARFRAYDNIAEAFGDYARLLKNDPRYRAALSAGTDFAEFAKRLQAGGYATDPEYAGKIGAILQSPALRNVLNGTAALAAAVKL
jgi:flagellar protein FlgJ